MATTAHPQALIVLGGGQTAEGGVPPYVQARFDAALAKYLEIVADGGEPPVIIALSAGTTHAPNPRDARGFDSKECTAGVKYLFEKAGVTGEPGQVGRSFLTRCIPVSSSMAHCVLLPASIAVSP